MSRSPGHSWRVSSMWQGHEKAVRRVSRKRSINLWAPLKTLGFAKNFAGPGVGISGSRLERGLRGHLRGDFWLTRGFVPLP